MPMFTDVNNGAIPGFFNDPTPGLTACRMGVWTGTTPTAAAPAAGGDVDFIAGQSHVETIGGVPTTVQPTNGYLALPGLLVMVESGGTFAANANLSTDASGRAVLAGAGKVVLRALEASTAAGQIVRAVFTSGR